MSEKIIRAHELVKLTGLSLSTIRRLERSGEFPSRVPIGSKAIGWLQSDIEIWFNTRTKIHGGKHGL